MQTQTTLLRKLERELEVLSYSQLSTALGYRSQNTVRNWVEKREIPERALPKVHKYFSKGGKK